MSCKQSEGCYFYTMHLIASVRLSRRLSHPLPTMVTCSVPEHSLSVASPQVRQIWTGVCSKCYPFFYWVAVLYMFYKYIVSACGLPSQCPNSVIRRAKTFNLKYLSIFSMVDASYFLSNKFLSMIRRIFFPTFLVFFIVLILTFMLTIYVIFCV